MNKKEIGKEIEVLIRSIKLHYDNIAEEVRIPSIELELITAKIRKLHDKSIIFNHLHYMEEQHARLSRVELEMESDDDETPEENFIINASEVPTPLATPNIEEKKVVPEPPVVPENVKPIEITNETPVEVVSKVIETKIEAIKEEVKVNPIEVTPPAAPTVTATAMVGKDLKKIIGFSDKYYFISQLFNGNADDFNAELNNLNLSSSVNNALEHIENIKKQKSWSDDNEALQSLKRYINNKFS